MKYLTYCIRFCYGFLVLRKRSKEFVMLFAAFKKVTVPVDSILKAFELKRKDLKGNAATVSHTLGYDHGVTWVSSDGKPWFGLRHAYIEAATNDNSQREIRFNIDEVNAKGRKICRVGSPAVLIIKPLQGDETEVEVVKIKRGNCIFGDKGRVEKFFAAIPEWKEHFKLHRTLG